jgi:hypothetical protein
LEIINNNNFLIYKTFLDYFNNDNKKKSIFSKENNEKIIIDKFDIIKKNIELNKNEDNLNNINIQFCFKIIDIMNKNGTINDIKNIFIKEENNLDKKLIELFEFDKEIDLKIILKEYVINNININNNIEFTPVKNKINHDYSPITKNILNNNDIQNIIETDLLKLLESIIEIEQTNCSLFYKNRLSSIKNIQQTELISLMEISYKFINHCEKIVDKKINILKGKLIF